MPKYSDKTLKTIVLRQGQSYIIISPSQEINSKAAASQL